MWNMMCKEESLSPLALRLPTNARAGNVSTWNLEGVDVEAASEKQLKVLKGSVYNQLMNVKLLNLRFGIK
jgi:hypothetical protein